MISCLNICATLAAATAAQTETPSPWGDEDREIFSAIAVGWREIPLFWRHGARVYLISRGEEVRECVASETVRCWEAGVFELAVPIEPPAPGDTWRGASYEYRAVISGPSTCPGTDQPSHMIVFDQIGEDGDEITYHYGYGCGLIGYIVRSENGDLSNAICPLGLFLIEP